MGYYLYLLFATNAPVLSFAKLYRYIYLKMLRKIKNTYKFNEIKKLQLILDQLKSPLQSVSLCIFGWHFDFAEIV